jgi:hypothetical protein
MTRLPLTAILVSLSVAASGCLGGSSTPATASHRPVLGTVEGRVFTTACGGPAAASCAPQNYRGSLVFCKTMNEIGPCPSAHVDGTGHYEITLRAGRYAVMPAPGKANVVMVRPRWVSIGDGKRTTLNITGGNSMK